MSILTGVDGTTQKDRKMRRGYAQTRLGQLHYAMTGDTENPAVVLLPQAGRTWSMFVELAGRLSDRYAVYAIDYPGSGASDPFTTDATIEDMAGGIVDFLDALTISRAHVYGIHAGNKVGAALAAGWPQRVHKLVLAGQSHSIVPSNAKRLGTVGKARLKLLAAADERESALVQWADLFNAISAAWWREGLMRNIGDRDARADCLVKVIDELQSAEGIRNFYRANRAYDLERDLHRITAPTLILEIATPHEDHEVGRQGQALLAIIPGSSLVTFEEDDCHGITLEDKPDQLAATLNRFFD